MTKLVELFGERKTSMTLFCSSHVAVFTLDISTPLESVESIGKKNQVILEFAIIISCELKQHM